MQSLLRYTAPLFVLLLGAALVYAGIASTRVVPTAAELVVVSGRLPVDADHSRGAYRSFQLDSLPGSTLIVKNLYLDDAAQDAFDAAMRAGAQVSAHVPKDAHAQRALDPRVGLQVHSLRVAGQPLLDLSAHLQQRDSDARSERGIYLTFGIFLALAGLLLGYARWRAPISRYR
jgi:hypothetical protein